jgi:hypothetical protein
MKSTKTMIVAALAAGALLACSSSLRAQDATNTPPAAVPGSGYKGHPNIARELNLTDDQKPKFREIMKNALEQRKALREDTSLTPEDRMAKLKQIQEDTATQLQALLTPDQLAKWQELVKKMHHYGPPPTAAPPSQN